MLDPALLRPGRFDRHVTVDRPTKKGRLEILKVHTRNTPLAADVDLDSIARGTVGMSGADLANLVNEAALLATREDKAALDMADFDAARDKIIMGAKREEVITEKEKRATAYHEVGHTLVAWYIPASRSCPQGHDHSPRPGPGRDPDSARPKTASATTGATSRRCSRCTWAAAPPNGWHLKTCHAGVADDLKRATRLARVMVTQCGHERPRRPGLLSRLGGASVPWPRDERDARPLRTHRAAHR